jgi:hypothetical protein
VSKHITEWNQTQVIEQIAAEVEANMETAAKVVEVDARHRLLRVRQPEFGAGYRRVLALFRLTSVVTRDGNAIEGWIGIPPGDKGGHYGFYIETGSSTAPAHPWLRPALFGNMRNILQLLSGG